MADRTCSVAGCEKPHKALGWCNIHYLRWRHHGDPLIVTNPHGTLGERFWSKVDRSAANGGCWLWTAQRDRSGYGAINAGGDRGVPLRAHRVAYELLVGPIPDGLVIDHLCRNTSCVNPQHLEPVTNAENIRRGLGGVLKTHCPHGHLYDEANTYITPTGKRGCRACRRAAHRRYMTRSRQC